MTECKYECKLDQETAKRALDELNENPKETLAAIETLWKWVKQQPHLKCPKDEAFLLMFLRLSHFSQLAAREQLDRFLTSVTKNRDFYGDLDVKDLEDTIKYGPIQLLPGRDVNGRRVMYVNEARINSKQVDPKKLPRAGLLTILYFLLDEKNQVNGLTGFIDGTGFNLTHKSLFKFEDRKRMIGLITGKFPVRIKAFNMYNLGEVFSGIVTIVTSFMPQKLRDRIKKHDNLETIYEIIPKQYLPEQFLPDDYDGPTAGSTDKINEAFRKELTRPEIRARILELTSSKYGVDESRRVSDNEPQASFKKLNVD